MHDIGRLLLCFCIGVLSSCGGSRLKENCDELSSGWSRLNDRPRGRMSTDCDRCINRLHITLLVCNIEKVKIVFHNIYILPLIVYDEVVILVAVHFLM